MFNSEVVGSVYIQAEFGGIWRSLIQRSNGARILSINRSGDVVVVTSEMSSKIKEELRMPARL